MKTVRNVGRWRVALISEHASPLAALGGADGGGQNVYVAQLATHLARAGHQVDVFTRRDDPALPEVVPCAPGVRVIHVDAGPPAPVRKEALLPLMPAFADFVEPFVRSVSYDLLHANFFMSGMVAAELKRRCGVPFAITFHALGKVRRRHQGEADGFPPEREAIETRLAREADMVIAECPQDVRDLSELYGADPARLACVPCGFDPAEFGPLDRGTARRGLNLPSEGPVILQLGRMVPRKGVDNVIRALGVLARRGLTARLLVVGGGSREPDERATPELARLTRVAGGAGVADQVSFVGSRARSELRPYYAAADVFVSTPWYEPFGITPLEAMACGVPVVGARVGGIQHSVMDGQTGYLVPPNDPDALADQLERVLSDPELARRLGEAGRLRAETHFTWQQVAHGVADVYRRVLEQPALPDLTLVDRGLDGASEALRCSRDALRRGVVDIAGVIARTFAAGNKVLVCGNGGSAADAQHFAAELVGRFLKPGRAGLPVIALTADGAVLTAWANDISFADVFARQVQALGRPGDLLLTLSTSGRSPNILAALRAARAGGLVSAALLGLGGDAASLADHVLNVPHPTTPRVQEIHILALHLICELVEEQVSAQPQPALPPHPFPRPPLTAASD